MALTSRKRYRNLFKKQTNICAKSKFFDVKENYKITPNTKFAIEENKNRQNLPIFDPK